MAAPRQPLHMLRALLREASYLPDATARTYFGRYIVTCFKAHQPSHKSPATGPATSSATCLATDAATPSPTHARVPRLLRKARKGLTLLRRANQGDMACLQKVLFLAYGRVGRRKHTLLAPLLRPDAIMDGGKLPLSTAAADVPPAPLHQLYYSSSRCLGLFAAPVLISKTHCSIAISDRFSRLRALIKSQHKKGLAIHRELKGQLLKTPIHNVWGRPMPIRRARNNVRRWYAETMTRILPPLPAQEWDKMHAMMLGHQPIGLVKPRAKSSLPTGTGPDSVATSETLFASTLHEAMMLSKPSRADRPAGMHRPHAITPKFMRRLYTKILTLCCKLEYHEETKRWTAIWGEPSKTIKPKLYAAPTDQHLFAGVDAKGHLPRTPKQHDLDKSTHVQPRNAEGQYMRFPFFAEFLPENNPLRKELDEWKRKRAAAAASAARAPTRQQKLP
ncbi:hypothetical protein COCMIDRAFT_105176 [Bipolaris oryzae ATCC 44560]|uniref:LYR motif-containing protein Cup1-like N-terminal domain-containing protein n=1 Tax=Bipolaris oryzae ATCC 44560 TaxID=930090 RepID=W6YW89_COCMI|nr:uncharacterized protein COCMIDRAFT_105176 [Bipolaris oryzae ATCC 44560]EUC41820.1 hypothetical protein COCMIDRAFT_105176 [Bipolaris oryzae ATCC 44560]